MGPVRCVFFEGAKTQFCVLQEAVPARDWPHDYPQTKIWDILISIAKITPTKIQTIFYGQW